MSHYTTFDAIQRHHSSSSKMRSSESEIAFSQDGDSLHTRHARLGRRESILGIRNIFVRSSKKDPDTASLSRSSKSSSLRASFAEISHWSHDKPTRSETFLASPSTSPDDRPHERRDSIQRVPTPNGASRRKLSPATTWNMPPLSKAYPSAIKHGILPAPTLSADAILRSHEKKSSPVTAETVALPDLAASDYQVSDIDKLKRKLRGEALASYNLQWTAKIYVLAPSGYLLQYSGEGHHDRLPEKVLRLGPLSAAFASDLIPGRHWVLQISSSTDNDGILQTESRSLFSKLQFRIPDRRTTANILMVFEGAEDMKEWITILRTQIEKMGSRRDLTDFAAAGRDVESPLGSHSYPFGRPTLRTSPSVLQSRHEPLLEEEEEEEEEAEAEEGEEEGRQPRPSNGSAAATDPDGGMQDSSLDDVSVTNSIISHDGRQLDALRESSHRFSYLSSGQRTVMTSTNSSPAGSPIVERFPRLSDGDSEAAPSRRTSWQAISPLSEDGIPEGSPATFGPQGSNGGATSNRRTSFGKTSPCESDAAPIGIKGGLSLFPRPSIRRQLGAIRVTRPLSTVEDQPSPKDNIQERPITSHHAGSQPSAAAEDVPELPRDHLMLGSHASGLNAQFSRVVGRRSSLTGGLKPANALNAPVGSHARRLSSLTSLRRQPSATGLPVQQEGDGSHRPCLSIRVCPSYSSHSLPRSGYLHARRPSAEASEAASHVHAALSRAAKRSSIASFCSDISSNGETSFSLDIPPMPAPPPSKALPPIPLRPSTSGRGKLSRKNSMPHVVEGPPPAPPPTCALPPIPIPRR